MKKLCQLLYSGLGGHGAVAFSIAEEMKRRGWLCTLGFVGIESLSPQYEEICRNRLIPLAFFPSRSGKPWISWGPITEWLQQHQPDAVILHGPTALPPALLHRFRFHSTRIICVEHQANTLKRRQDWIASGLQMLTADNVVVLTEPYMQQLADKLGFFYNQRKVEVIPTGLNGDNYTPANVKSKSTKHLKRLGMAARFTKGKRHDVLLNMLKTLRKDDPYTCWELSLAGDGDTLRDVRQWIEREGLENHVQLPGQLGDDALVHWYRSLDIYLQASDGETLSTSLLQAMLLGIPIVASEVQGIWELLAGPPPLATLVKAPDGSSFAQAVRHALNNPEDTNERMARARATALNRFSQAAMGNAYELLLGQNTGRVIK